MSDAVVAMPVVGTRRTLARSILAVLVLAPVLVVGSPAGAETLSAGCTAANERSFDGQYGGGGVGEQPFFAGERIIATAGHPASGPVENISLTLDGIIVDTAPFPGTVSYTFPADTVVQDPLWFAMPPANVTWTVECGSSPTSPTTKDQCKDGGHEAFGFKNQGQCVRFVAKKK